MGDTLTGRVKTKTATTAQWETVKNDFVPMKGEIVVYSDGNDGEAGIKVGDGTSKVGVLPIINKTVQADWTEANSSAPSYIKHKPEFAEVAYSGSYDDLDDKPDADEIPYDEVKHQTSTGANNVGDAIEYLDQAVAGADKVRYAIITMTDTENGTSNLSAQEIYTIDHQRRVWIFAFVTLGGKKVYAPLLYSVNDSIDGYVAVFAYEDQVTAGYNYARIVVINKSVKVTWKNAYVAAGDDISLLNNDTGFITGANVPSNETDPTIYAWAKAATKPSYDADEIEYDDAEHSTSYGDTNVGDVLENIYNNKADVSDIYPTMVVPLTDEEESGIHFWLADVTGQSLVDVLSADGRVEFYTNDYLPSKQLRLYVSEYHTSLNGYTFSVFGVVEDKVYGIELISDTGDVRLKGSGFVVWQIPQNVTDLSDSANYPTKLNLTDADVRTAAIPMGAVDGTSTATVFTATVPGITALKTGVCMMLSNHVVTSAAGFTININNLGAKKCYNNMTNATQDTTMFNVNYTMLFVYDETLDSGSGGWWLYRGYNSDNNTIGYTIRTNQMQLPVKTVCYRYRLLFSSMDGQYYIPANTSTSTNATAKRTPTTEPFDPFGRIIYYNATTALSVGGKPTTGVQWQQYNISLGYSFNTTGSALVLTVGKPVWLKCTPQSDGSVVIDPTVPYVQDLPNTEDGYVYIWLGVAYSAANIELTLEHPIKWYKNGAIRNWFG